MTTPALRRSMLFVPGNNPGMITASPHFGADSVILDLEDSIPVSEKDSARTLTRAALRSYSFDGAERVVRVNAMSTPYAGGDIEAAVEGGADAILVPKADPDALSVAAALVTRFACGRDVKLIALIETAAGLVSINECARSPLVSGLFLGAEDLTVDAGMERTKEGSEILYARSALVFAAAAARISSVDSPYIDVADDAGLRKDLETTRRLGFTGKACVHPLQVQIVHEELAPTAQQVSWAHRVIAADLDARSRGIGAVALDGQMIDVPIVTRARAILAKAAPGGGRDGD